MEEKALASKDQILKYMQDMAEIEVAEFTLRKTAEEMKRLADSNVESANSAVKKLEDAIWTEKNHIEKAESEKQYLENCSRPHELSPPPSEPVPPQGWNWTRYDKATGNYDYKIEKTHFSLFKDWEIHYFLLISAGIAIFAVPIIAIIVAIAVYVFNAISGNLTAVSTEIVPLCLIVSTIIYFLGATIYGIRNYKKEKREFSGNYSKNLTLLSQYNKFATEYFEYTKKANEYKEQEKTYNREIENYRRWHEQEVKLENSIKQCKELIQKNSIALSAAQKRRNIESAKSNLIYRQIDFLLEKAQTIHINKERMYEANIIPPDYRDLDCILMFHQIFRNDLADTMREAIKIYEERIFRQEVIRGIDKIYKMLGHLAASMNSIESRLIQIRDDISIMSNDVYQISHHLCAVVSNQNLMLDNINQYQSTALQQQQRLQEKQKKLFDQQIQETRASRYATEALKDSADRLVWYEQQKWFQSL